MSDHETLSMLPMTREMCHEFYREFERDPATFMDMSLFEPFVYDPEWVDHYFDRQQDLGRVLFVVMKGGQPVGEVKLWDIDREKRECNWVSICEMIP